MKHRIAFFGFGGMAKWHYERVMKRDDLDLAGIWDIRECRRELAAEMGIHVYQSQEDLLADESVDLVLIATPNDVHKPLAIAAMEAGKNVVSEKPVTLSSKDLQEMIDVSERTGKVFTVHQNRRWDQDFNTVKKILKEVDIGEIHKIESRIHGSRGIPGDWRQLPEKGGGMVLDWGVHLLDQLLLFYPDAKIKSVHAIVTNVTNQLVDDGFTVTLMFDNGVTMVCEVGTSNFVSLPRFYVLGANGTAIIEEWTQPAKIVRATGVDEKDVVPVVTAAGLTKTMAPRRPECLSTQEIGPVVCDVSEFYTNVLAAIEGREELIVQMPQVMRVMRLMEAVFRSAELNQVVGFE